MSDSAGSDAVSSPIMSAEISLIPSTDDGTPLKLFLMSEKSGSVRVRLISGLQDVIEDPAEAKAEMARIVRASRRRLWWERVDQRDLLHKHAADPKQNPHILDALRLSWQADPTKPYLRISHSARADTGARLMMAKTDEHRLVPAQQARRLLWQLYRINLGALRAFLDVVPAPGGVTIPRADWGVFERQGEVAFFNEGDKISGEAGYYDYEAFRSLEEIVVENKQARGTKNARHLYPWHKGAGADELSIGLRISKDGDEAEILFFEGADPSVQYPFPFRGSDKSLKPKIQKIARLLALIRTTTENVRGWAVEFREAIGQDAATVQRLDRKITEAENQIREKRQEIAAAYADAVAIVAQNKETMLATARARDVKIKAYAEAKRVTSEIRPNYTRATPYFTQLMPHLTAVPVDFLFSGENPRTGKLQVSHKALDKTGAERQLTLDIYAPAQMQGGLQDLMKAARSLLNTPLSWLPIHVLVALHHNPGEVTYIDDQKAYLIDVGEFWRATHPNEVGDISRRGLSDWFKRKYPSAGMGPVEALVASIQFLSGVVLSTGTSPDDGEIGGLLFYHGRLPTRTRGRVEIIYTRNLLLAELEAGTEIRKSHYMYVDRRAMFSCKSQMRAACAPLQIYLENLTRSAALGGGKRMETEAGHILVGRSPQGDEMTLGTLIEACGLYGKRKDDLFTRMERAIGTLEDLGVVASHRYKGSKTNPFECKVELAMSKDYNGLYSVSRIEDEVREIDRHLVSSPLKPLPAPGSKPRGRPPKRRA